MRRRFSILTVHRAGYDTVQCVRDDCKLIWWTGDWPDNIGCPRCCAKGWETITDSCKHCGGYAKFMPDVRYRACVDRSGCLYLPAGHAAALRPPKRLEVQALVQRPVSPGDPVRGPDGAIMGYAKMAGGPGELIIVVAISGLPPGDLEAVR